MRALVDCRRALVLFVSFIFPPRFPAAHPTAISFFSLLPHHRRVVGRARHIEVHIAPSLAHGARPRHEGRRPLYVLCKETPTLRSNCECTVRLFKSKRVLIYLFAQEGEEWPGTASARRRRREQPRSVRCSANAPAHELLNVAGCSRVRPQLATTAGTPVPPPPLPEEEEQEGQEQEEEEDEEEREEEEGEQ